MKAIQVQPIEAGGYTLAWGESPDPVCGPDDVLVRVAAAALNRADLMQAQGHYPPPPGASTILGLDLAGEIVALGAHVTGWQVGDRVAALVTGGAYAELAAVPAGMLMPVPAGWSDEEAAALPEVFLTAFVNVFMEAGFQPGETVLMHGGASGVGTALIQLVHQSGGTVIVTAGGQAKVDACRALGANLAIDYRSTDFVEEVRRFTSGRGADIIIDLVGADYLARNLATLAVRGRLVLVSTLSGGRAEINLGGLMARRQRIIGSVLRGRTADERAEINRRFLEQFGPLLADGTIRPVIDAVFPIAEAAAAHRRMAQNLNIGKIVLKLR